MLETQVTDTGQGPKFRPCQCYFQIICEIIISGKIIKKTLAAAKLKKLAEFDILRTQKVPSPPFACVKCQTLLIF